MNTEYRKPDDIISNYKKEHNITDNGSKTNKSQLEDMLKGISALKDLKIQSKKSREFFLKKAELKRKLKNAKKENNILAISNLKSEMNLLIENFSSK